MAQGEEVIAPKDTAPEATEAPKEPKKIVRTEEEVRKMTTKQYLDEMVVPTLNKGLLALNKERPVEPLEFLAKYLIKAANAPQSSEEAKTAAPVPME